MSGMKGIFGHFVKVVECVFALGRFAWIFLHSLFQSRTGAAARIVALESQLDVCLRRGESKRVGRFSSSFRFLWVMLSWSWDGWERVCHVMKPRTVVGWQQKAFQQFWRWKSRGKVGRKRISVELRRLIRRISRENPLWGATKIRDVLVELGFEEVRTAYNSPWQNPFVERFFGSLRRELLDQVIILHEQHLRNLLSEYVSWYENVRLHQGLAGDSPVPGKDSENNRAGGKIVSIPVLGGLHHRYERIAA